MAATVAFARQGVARLVRVRKALGLGPKSAAGRRPASDVRRRHAMTILKAFVMAASLTLFTIALFAVGAGSGLGVQ
jgi:hypothetical protein